MLKHFINPRVKTLHKIAVSFNMTLSEFLDFQELNDYDFDDDDEIYFDDDDEECCCGCKECAEEVVEEADVEKELDAIDDEVEDVDTATEVPKPEKGDF